MNGVQLTVEVRRIRPDLKIVLASGYATSARDGERRRLRAARPQARESDLLASILQTA